MILIEQLQKGKSLIQKGRLTGKDTSKIEQKISELENRLISSLPKISIEEFSKTNLAVEIYSDILKENIWFCPNEKVIEQVQGDHQIATCYLPNELK